LRCELDPWQRRSTCASKRSGVRLQKFLAHAGVASRRRAETFIVAGHVRINGTVVHELGSRVGPDDQVEFAGRPLRLSPEKRYLVLHKPAGVMTTMRDPQGRRTVAALVPSEPGRVVPVGRLDYDTSGVLLLTNDGELAHVLTHPRFGTQKTYRAVVRGRLGRDDVAQLLTGMSLPEGRPPPPRLRVIRSGSEFSELDVTIHEGRNRQIRRMFEATAHPVVSLVRLRFGPIALGDLRAGNWRAVTERELAALRTTLHEASDLR